MITPTRIILDPTEDVWRADWVKHWAYCREAGWTEVRTELLADGTPGAERLVCLREDADCTREMGRGIKYDYRVALIRLQKIGWIRGWLYDEVAA
jgi:hypothetical protein